MLFTLLAVMVSHYNHNLKAMEQIYYIHTNVVSMDIPTVSTSLHHSLFYLDLSCGTTSNLSCAARLRQGYRHQRR